MYTLNPKSVSLGELYGEVNLQSNEWRDGLISTIVRNACTVSTQFSANCSILLFFNLLLFIVYQVHNGRASVDRL